MDNSLFEFTGAATGIAGALLLALKLKWSGWAFAIFLVSNLAWIVFSVATGTYGLLAQEAVYLAINLVGAWRWLIQPHLQTRLIG
jgi:hypothetical protein